MTRNGHQQPQLRSARVNDMRLTAAKDRTFKTVRLNQGIATQTVPIPRRPLLLITGTSPADDPSRTSEVSARVI